MTFRLQILMNIINPQQHYVHYLLQRISPRSEQYMLTVRTEIHLHRSVMYYFHLTYFHKTQNSAMALCEDMLYPISLKSVKKFGKYRQKFENSL